MELNLTSIKFKEREGTEFNEIIDWRKIEEDKQCHTTYTNTLRDMISPDISYKDFFDATILAGKWTALLN
jgi:phosphatidate phosphatase PAH1